MSQKRRDPNSIQNYSREKIDSMNDYDKENLAANLLNEFDMFDGKIDYTSEILFIRSNVKNIKSEYGDNPKLENLILPKMYSKRAEKIKAVVAVNGFVSFKKEYYKTLKINKGLEYNEEGRTLFQNAEEIEVDGMKNVAESI